MNQVAPLTAREGREPAWMLVGNQRVPDLAVRTALDRHHRKIPDRRHTARNIHRCGHRTLVTNRCVRRRRPPGRRQNNRLRVGKRAQRLQTTRQLQAAAAIDKVKGRTDATTHLAAGLPLRLRKNPLEQGQRIRRVQGLVDPILHPHATEDTRSICPCSVPARAKG